MKRVLIFSLAYHPRVGGAELAIQEITGRITPADIEFHVLTLRFSSSDAREEKIGNVFVHRLGSGSSSYAAKILFIPRAALCARHLHRAQPFDALWAMMTYMVLPIVLAQRFGWARVPYAVTLQDGDPFEHVFKRWYIRIWLGWLRRGFREAAVVSALSNYLAAWARQMGYAGEVCIVPNGVDAARFGSALPAALGKEAGEIVLITTSRLVHKNAVDDILRALALLPASIKLLVLGAGPDEAMLKKLAQKIHVAGRVTWLGYIGHAELPGYLRACDVFVRPSRSEGFGSSFVEAMAAGLPVIATQEGGIADFLFDATRNPERPTTGWAVEKNSQQQIADAVKDILANPEGAARVVAHARAMVQQKYDWSVVAKDMREKVFAAVLA